MTATALLTVFGAWAVPYPFYVPFGLQAPLTTPGVAGSLIGSAVYLGFCAVFGLGLGALVRSSTVGAILVFLATLLGPVLTSVLPFGLLSRVLRLMLIGNAGDAMSRIVLPDAPFLDLWSGYISPPAGWLLAGGWAIITLIGGAIALQRRDA